MTARTVLLVLGTVGAVGLTGGAAVGTVQAIARQERVDVVDLRPTPRIELDTGGRVELRRGPLRLEASRRWSFREPQVAVSRSGGATRVTARCGAPGPCEVDLVLTVPEGVALDVRSASLLARGVTGTLTARVRGEDAEVLRHEGALSLDVLGGDTSVDQLVGDLEVRSRGGEVRAHDLRAERVEVTALVGGAALDFSAPPQDVLVEVTGSDAEVLLPEAEYRVQAQSLGGDERVDVAEADDATRLVRVVARGGDAVVGRG